MTTLLIMGCWFLLEGLISIRFPRILIGKRLARDFAECPQKRKHYLLHQRINLFLIGAVLLGFAFIPETLIYRIGIPSLVLLFLSILWCNKRNLGRFTPYHILTE